MEEVTFDAARREGSVVRFEEHHADDVVTDVTLTLQLLRVVFLVRKLRRYVEHDLDRSPVRVDRVQSGQVVDRVQASLVLVEA